MVSGIKSRRENLWVLAVGKDILGYKKHKYNKGKKG